MSVKDYKKADAVGFGNAVGSMVDAVRGNGVGAARFKELIRIVISAGEVVNEMKDVPEAAIEHTVGGISDKLGDCALQRALDAEGTVAPE